MLQSSILSVSGVSEVCCKVFHMDVAILDRDVACCNGCTHICCKLLFPMFYLFRRILQMCLYVSHICLQIFLSGCCLYFCNDFKCFLGISDACFKCFIYLHMYVVTVASEYFKSRSGVASPSSPSAASPRCLRSSTSRRRLGIRRLLPLFSMPVTFGMARGKDCGRGRPDASRPNTNALLVQNDLFALSNLMHASEWTRTTT